MNARDMKRRLEQSKTVDALVARLMPILGALAESVDGIKVQTLADRRALRRLITDIHPLGEEHVKAVYVAEIQKARAEMAASRAKAEPAKPALVRH